MDDLDIPRAVKAADDTHMGILGIEDQIAGNRLGPGDWGAVAVLHPGPAAVAYDVGTARDVIENPINEPGAVQAVRSHGSGAGAAGGPDLFGRSPTGVPSQNETLDSDR